MKTSQIAFALFVALLVQTTLVGVVAQQTPVDLVLIVVVFAALAGGPVVGLWTGTFGGLVQDILSGGVIGASGLAKTIAGVLVGIAASQFILGAFWNRLAILVAASLIHTLSYVCIYALIDSGSPVATAGMVGLQALLNAVIGVAALALVRVVPGIRARFSHSRDTVSRRHWMMS